DQVIALFGVPRSTGHDAYAAVRAAREMIEARTTLNARAARPLDVGIGVASGTVVAGCLGSADRLNYTVLGERVNLAARLCAQAGQMEVLIDDATQRRLGALVGVEAVPPLALPRHARRPASLRLRRGALRPWLRSALALRRRAPRRLPGALDAARHPAAEPPVRQVRDHDRHLGAAARLVEQPLRDRPAPLRERDCHLRRGGARHAAGVPRAPERAGSQAGLGAARPGAG